MLLASQRHIDLSSGPIAASMSIRTISVEAHVFSTVTAVLHGSVGVSGGTSVAGVWGNLSGGPS